MVPSREVHLNQHLIDAIRYAVLALGPLSCSTAWARLAMTSCGVYCQAGSGILQCVLPGWLWPLAACTVRLAVTS